MVQNDRGAIIPVAYFCEFILASCCLEVSLIPTRFLKIARRTAVCSVVPSSVYIPPMLRASFL